MKRLVTALFVFCSLFIAPAMVEAAQNVSRAEGFALIWQSMKRPALPVTKDRYSDVPKGSTGELEIQYARSRGMLPDDEETFSPDESLDRADAIEWLLKTRNIDDLDELTPEALPGLALR